MLVLTRKEGQEIRIADDIVITVLHTGTEVRLGVKAPREVRVVRGEIAEAQAAAAAHQQDTLADAVLRLTAAGADPGPSCDDAAG